ncbi:hypothetical protein FD755_025583 [Muntiacus reevesi]|uniref:Ig-like domain-containing protein n=1 Tax=Muntiacus reevesi TaxID=9886 RepID=A0A5N3ULI1_MUNRE|nr:hypothetical protein FD755_025584 [Muntiacus reevesi]KAB0337514.1 hypothetical protein FD755_025583 [Muntiacus reevesi]
MSPLEAFTFFSFWASGLGLSKVEQAQISLSTEVKKSINIHCKIESTNFESETVYWYRQKRNQALEHLVYVTSTTTAARSQVDGKNKIEARKDARMFTSTLTVNFIEKEDVGIYYCAGWSSRHLGSHLHLTFRLYLTLYPMERLLLIRVNNKIYPGPYEFPWWQRICLPGRRFFGCTANVCIHLNLQIHLPFPLDVHVFVLYFSHLLPWAHLYYTYLQRNC